MGGGRLRVGLALHWSFLVVICVVGVIVFVLMGGVVGVVVVVVVVGVCCLYARSGVIGGVVCFG